MNDSFALPHNPRPRQLRCRSKSRVGKQILSQALRHQPQARLRSMCFQVHQRYSTNELERNVPYAKALFDKYFTVLYLTQANASVI